MKSYKGREAIQALGEAGWNLLRYHKGDHVLFGKGHRRISVPDQSSTIGDQGLLRKINDALTLTLPKPKEKKKKRRKTQQVRPGYQLRDQYASESVPTHNKIEVLVRLRFTVDMEGETWQCMLGAPDLARELIERKLGKGRTTIELLEALHDVSPT